MKYRWLLLLFLGGTILDGAEKKTHCVLFAKDPAHLEEAEDKFCLTFTFVAGLPAGSIVGTYFAKPKDYKKGTPLVPFAQLNYRRIYSFEPGGRLSLILIEGNDTLVTEKFSELSVVVFNKISVPGKPETGELKIGESETEGENFHYLALPN